MRLFLISGGTAFDLDAIFTFWYLEKKHQSLINNRFPPSFVRQILCKVLYVEVEPTEVGV